MCEYGCFKKLNRINEFYITNNFEQQDSETNKENLVFTGPEPKHYNRLIIQQDKMRCVVPRIVDIGYNYKLNFQFVMATGKTMPRHK